MGYQATFRDVTEARSVIGTQIRSDNAFQYHEQARAGRVHGVHSDLDIRGRIRECRKSARHPHPTPVVLAMDVTKSRGNDARIIYEGIDHLMGSLVAGNFVPSPQLLISAIGDATNDVAPLQVGQFEAGRDLIRRWTASLWMEEGGGGSGEESYELGAYYFAKKTVLDSLDEGRKGLLFFTADEAPYPTVSSEMVQRYIGDTIKKDINTEQIFTELQEKYRVYLIYPGTTAEQRKRSIDSEIQQRLERFGGQYKNVDIRVSLLWNTIDDLDLHAITPGKEEIYYGNKQGHCGGFLDIDKNAGADLSEKPVENIQWRSGVAKKGRYQVWVDLYRRRTQGKIPFKLELDVNGEIETFDGVIPASAESNMNARTHTHAKQEFTFIPGVRQGQTQDELAEYREEVVLSKWQRYLPTQNIIRVTDPAYTIESILGVTAIQGGTLDLQGFVANMKERRVGAEQRAAVEKALKAFADQGTFAKVEENIFD